MRQALVQMRLSQNKQALAVAEQAMALADAGRDNGAAGPRRCCAWPKRSCAPASTRPRCASAQRAAAMFEAAGDALHLGRAHWVMAFAQTRLSRNEASRAPRSVRSSWRASPATPTAWRNALNVLSFSCQDIAERLALLQQAAEAFDRAGYAYGRMLVLGNLSLTFGELGLWRHALPAGRAMHRHGRAHGRTPEPGAGIPARC